MNLPPIMTPITGEQDMTEWLITISQHVDAMVPDSRDILQGDTFTDAVAGALSIALAGIHPGDVQDCQDAIRQLAVKIAEPAPIPDERNRSGPLVLLGLPDGDDTVLYAAWHHYPVPGTALPNIGIGPAHLKGDSYQLDGKEDNRWIKIEKWDGNPSRRGELAALDREQLIDRIVRLEAIS